MAFDGKKLTNPHGEFIFRKVDGYTDCGCCGMTIVGQNVCDGCTGKCDPATTWHCFFEHEEEHCDGSGCSYRGECRGYESAAEYKASPGPGITTQ